FFGHHKAFKPGARTFTGRDTFLLMQLSITEQEQVEGGELVGIHDFEMGRNTEGGLGGSGGRGFEFAKRQSADTLIAAEAAANEWNARFRKRCERAVVVLGFIGAAIGQGDQS